MFQEGVTGGEGIESVGNIVGGQIEKLLKLINVGIPDAFKSASSEILSTLKQYDTAIFELQTKYFGGGREFENNIRAALSSGADGIIKMGGSLKDVQKIQKDISETLNTNFILQGETYSEIYAAAQLTAGSTADATAASAKLISDFKTLGFSLFDIGEKTGEIIQYTKSLGVNTSEVFQQIGKNMDKLNLYNFSEGVNGMAKMAAQASMLRIDMSTTLGIAEKLFKPEQAIEMAAGFQRLGVQVTDLLDPLRLMDLSLNDPAKLQESIIEMTKSLTYFDEKNQKISILPGEQRRLRELADVMGMNVNELAKMAMGAGELEEKFKRFKVPSFVPEDQKEEVKNLIANLGQLKDGKLMVTIPGTKEMVEASELNKDQIESLRKLQEDKAKSPVELQIEANGLLNQIVNEGIAFKGAIPRAIAGSENVISYINEGAKELQAQIENFKKSVGVLGEQAGILNEMNKKSLKEGDYTKLFTDLLDRAIPKADENTYKEFNINISNLNINFESLKDAAGKLGNKFVEIFEKIKTFATTQSTTITAGDFIKFPGENVITLPEDTLFGATTKGPEKFENVVKPEAALPPKLPEIPTQIIKMSTPMETTSKGEVSGTIVLKIESDGNMNFRQLEDYLNNPLNMVKIAESLNPILGNIKKTETVAFS